MKLKLERPIVFFDLETTGTDVTQDRIVEISLIKVMPDGSEIRKTRRVNPGIPIPEDATAVHNITDEDVKDEPMFCQMAKSLAGLFENCDIAGFNSNRFDVPLLDEEFHRAGVEFDFSNSRFIDVQSIFHQYEPRTLTAAYRFYCDKDLEGAHAASADIDATYEVLMAQLDRYEGLPNDMGKIAEMCSSKNVDFLGRLVYDDQNREIINFGKYKGQIAEEIIKRDIGYYDWLMRSDFPHNTKQCFERIHERIRKKFYDSNKEENDKKE